MRKMVIVMVFVVVGTLKLSAENKIDTLKAERSTINLGYYTFFLDLDIHFLTLSVDGVRRLNKQKQMFLGGGFGAGNAVSLSIVEPSYFYERFISEGLHFDLFTRYQPCNWFHSDVGFRGGVIKYGVDSSFDFFGGYLTGMFGWKRGFVGSGIVVGTSIDPFGKDLIVYFPLPIIRLVFPIY